MAATTLCRLDLLGRPVPVVLGGGVIAADRPILMDDVRDRLMRVAHRAQVRVVATPPIIGA